MLDSKRRPASTQAVSRKVEGIEPRNQVNRKDDGVKMSGSQHRHNRKGEGVPAPGGSCATTQTPVSWRHNCAVSATTATGGSAHVLLRSRARPATTTTSM